jgi:hypothetical protein
MQDKWKAFKEKHDQATEKAWQEYQERVREVNRRYADEIAKSKKLEEEVKSLCAKVDDLEKLAELVCFGGDQEEEEGESVEQRIHACPCQKAASSRIGHLTRQVNDLNSERSKDKRKVGFYKYLKERKLKNDGPYHRGYVFKEERVATGVLEEVEARRQEEGVGPAAEEQEARVEDQHVQPPKDLSIRGVQRAARELVENLVYMADGGRTNSARIFECLLRNPTIKTVMEHVHGLTGA